MGLGGYKALPTAQSALLCIATIVRSDERVSMGHGVPYLVAARAVTLGRVHEKEQGDVVDCLGKAGAACLFGSAYGDGFAQFAVEPLLVRRI